jgi:hypothetical protein
MSAVLLLLAVASTSAISCGVLAASFRRVHEEQIGRGLFGQSERERLIVRSARSLIASAEREVRLAHFGARLRSRAWEGAVVEIDSPTLRHASTWRFPDGERWSVDLATAAPRHVPRVVIHSLEVPGTPALRVDAYVPGRRDLTLLVTDAQPLDLAGR